MEQTEFNQYELERLLMAGHETLRMLSFGVAHQIRNPLSTIQGIVGLITEDMEEKSGGLTLLATDTTMPREEMQSKMSKYAQDLESNTTLLRTAQANIERIKATMKAYQEIQEPVTPTTRKEPSYIESILRSAIVQQKIENYNLRIDGDRPPKNIMVDDHLERSISKLVENIVKYADAATKPQIIVTYRADCIEVEMTNTTQRPLIDSDIKALGVPLYPIGEGTKTPSVGLAIARDWITRLGGGFLVEYHEKQFSTKIRLPYEGEKTMVSSFISGAHYKRRIIAVDDEDDIIEMIKRTLQEKAGYEVTGFTDPKQAIEELKKNGHKYNGMILDRKMPIYGEVVQATAIRHRLPAALHTIVLSAEQEKWEGPLQHKPVDLQSATDHELAQAFEGYTMRLGKPISMENLRKAVRVMIGEPELHKVYRSPQELQTQTT